MIHDEESLQDIQKKVDDWIIRNGGYWNPLSMTCAIIEEVGEVAREINSIEGYKPKKSYEKSDLAEEMGDLVFSIICLANYYQVDLGDSILKTIKKYSTRDANRFLK
ncbi:MAG: nucleotide pyrophosphohydrolase [Promethearchaeota archaeon]